MEDFFKTLPQYTCSWSKGMVTLYKYQGFWNIRDFLEGGIIAQQSFKAQPTDIFLCSCPKTGTTWLKALAFAIVTREKFNESTSPLLTTMPHECIPFLEKDLKQIEDNHKNSSFPLVATHLPYTSLPESVISSDCKIVYIYRNIKDVVNSNYHFVLAALNIPLEDVSFREMFDEFCQGLCAYGPYWDHVLGYWKARQERPGRILFLKYEDMKKDPKSNVMKLAEFIGYPFLMEEENAGVVDNIINLCSFNKLSNLEVNKTGKHRTEDPIAIENRHYFRKAKDRDWENYFTEKMKEKIDQLVDQKLSGTRLVLK